MGITTSFDVLVKELVGTIKVFREIISLFLA